MRLPGRPDLALVEVGRAPQAMEEAALGLPSADQRLLRLRRRFPRRLLRLLPSSLAGADRWLGGVDVFHHILARDPLPVSRARQTIALSELPSAGSREEDGLRGLLARMAGVIVFSGDYERRLALRFGLEAERVHRVTVGCEHWRRQIASLPEPESPPVVLVLGAMRRERQHHVVTQAFGLLRARGIEARLKVVLSSGGGSGGPTPARAGSRGNAVEFLRVGETEMPGLVARASVLVHLNEDEGTPVTPLEAFALGVPVVASRLPAFEEALGGLAELIDNAEIDGSPDRLAGALARAIAGRADAGRSSARMGLARGFTWERCAAETVVAWGRALSA